jgi:hypothetical protein
MLNIAWQSPLDTFQRDQPLRKALRKTCKRRCSLIYDYARMLPLMWQSRKYVSWFRIMFNSCLLKVRRKHSFCCESTLEVAEIGLLGYEVFPMVLDLGTLVSGSDDVS